jgi:TRAP-type mannitol/chloroaromatic compound transport system substrate-binding protein
MARYARLLLTAVAVAAPVLTLATPAQAATEVALWHMEDPSVMTDASGNNNGTPSGVTSVQGSSGNGYHFDKTDGVIVKDSPTLKPGTSDFSVTVHVRFTTPPSAAVGDYDLIRKGVSSTTGGEWKIEIFPGNNLTSPAFCLFKDTAKKVANIRGTKNLADGAWHTITCAKTSTSITLTVDSATQSKAVSLGSISNSDPLGIGQKPGGGDQYVGDMDEVSITSGTSTGGDFTPPTVATKSPAAGATGVSPDTDVTATFSEAVQNVTGTTFKLKNTATGTAVPATVSLDPNSTVGTLHPNSSLAAGTKYTATLTAGIQDLAGNKLTATSWTFTTGVAAGGDITPPKVVTKSPASGATGVSPTTDVTATFSEAVKNVTGTTFKLRNTATSTLAPATVSLDANSTVATLHPSVPLLPGIKYTAVLTSGIQDLAGNPLTQTSWSFTIAP